MQIKEPKEIMSTFLVRTPKETWENLSMIAIKKGLSKSNIINKYIKKYVEKNKELLDNR